MRNIGLLGAVVLLLLAGCATATAPPPAAAPDAVTRSTEQNGRFIAFVGPRRQHAEPFLGVPATNFYALRSWIDTRNGEVAYQLYVEDSYFGTERNWEAARAAAGQKLKFVEISKNEITCESNCSYAEEFGAELPEALLRASGNGLSVIFTAKLGLQKTIAVPPELIAKQLAAVQDAGKGIKPAPPGQVTPPPVLSQAAAPAAGDTAQPRRVP